MVPLLADHVGDEDYSQPPLDAFFCHDSSPAHRISPSTRVWEGTPMAAERVQRRLAAILVPDVVGQPSRWQPDVGPRLPWRWASSACSGRRWSGYPLV